MTATLTPTKADLPATDPYAADHPSRSWTVDDLPVWEDDPREKDLSEEEADFLFELRGFRVLRGALSSDQLSRLNAFVDDKPVEDIEPGQWFGHVESHTYGGTDGVNFQNVIEGGEVFEELIDHDAWIPQVRRVIESAEGAHKLSIDENFLNVRRQGGFIPLHSGGHTSRLTSCFRSNAGNWMVGQVNVLMALTDTSPEGGCTTIIPGSHKLAIGHPKDKNKLGWAHGVSGPETIGMVAVPLRAGDAVMFSDACYHGSVPRDHAR